MTSEEVAKRLRDANVKYFANDCIAEHIKDVNLDKIEGEVEKHIEAALRALIIDVDNDHNTHDTARRIAKSWVREKFAGRYQFPPKVTSFPNTGYKSLYTSGPITVRSTCAHHFENIVGKCWVGVIPTERVIGLSKFNRIVHHIAERPQIQEEMTSQIADALVAFAETPNIAVVVRCEHHCMTARGVKEHESEMATAIMRGLFDTDLPLRQEFYALVGQH